MKIKYILTTILSSSVLIISNFSTTQPEIDNAHNGITDTSIQIISSVESIISESCGAGAIEGLLPTAVATLDCSTGGTANKCCAYWDVTYTMTFPWPTVSCSTGGEFKCEKCE